MSSKTQEIIVSEWVSRGLCNVAQELAIRMIKECGARYSFDALVAIRELGLETVTISKNRNRNNKKSKESVKKVAIAKASFPLPFNGECNGECCQALRQNNGLYTQCLISRKDGKEYCKSCQQLADKSVDGVPEYGTIQQRMAVDIFEYVDPKGRKPVSYTKVMKKYKLTQEQVLEEAGKLNITINESHFIAPTAVVKRGRPASEKAPKEPKGAKGRPKKTKKVLEIEGDEEDLFAALVADANDEEDNGSEVSDMTTDKAAEKAAKEAEKAAEKAAKEAEKAAKEEQRLKEKAEKEAKLAEEKAAKEEQRLKEKAEKESKLAEEKAAKLAAKEAEKAAKKESKKPAKKAPVQDDEEPDVVKKIEVDGKKYLKSKKSGIIYDYSEYVKNGEQVVVGKWNDSKNMIEFEKSGEESEEEYDEE